MIAAMGKSVAKNELRNAYAIYRLSFEMISSIKLARMMFIVMREAIAIIMHVFDMMIILFSRL